MWLTCTVMPSRVAFPQWWRGALHVQLMCGSRVAHMHGNALMCGISSMVEGRPSRTAHVWELLTCGSYSRVRRATKVKFFTPWCLHILCLWSQGEKILHQALGQHLHLNSTCEYIVKVWRFEGLRIFKLGQGKIKARIFSDSVSFDKK